MDNRGHEAAHDDGERADDTIMADAERTREVRLFAAQDNERNRDHAVGHAGMPFVASRTSASTASHVVHGALRASIFAKSSVRDADGNGSVDGETPGDGRKRIMPDARRHVPTRVSAAKKNGTTGAPASIAPVKTVRTTPSAPARWTSRTSSGNAILA